MNIELIAQNLSDIKSDISEIKSKLEKSCDKIDSNFDKHESMIINNSSSINKLIGGLIVISFILSGLLFPIVISKSIKPVEAEMKIEKVSYDEFDEFLVYSEFIKDSFSSLRW